MDAPTPGRSHRPPTVRRLLVAVTAVPLVLVLGACGGSDADGRATKPAAPRPVERKAGLVSDGTAVCIVNRSSDVLSITIIRSEGGQEGYGDVSGTDNFPPGTQRCMKSDTVTASERAVARITIASGEQFQPSGFNTPLPGYEPWIEVNNDSRELEVGDTTDFKIGKHPIQGERRPDVNGWKLFVARIS